MLRVTNVIRDAVHTDIIMFVECRNDIVHRDGILKINE